MQILRLFVATFLILTVGAHAENVVIESVDDYQISDKDIEILKLETKVRDLEIEISDLKDRFEQIEYLQKKVIDIVGESEEEAENIFTRKAKLAEYQYAYNQIIDNNFNKAERAFDLYLEKYPNDEKIGEIYFWKGEISYKRKDYTDALEYYLTSYQKYPDNSRYLDSLFKMSIVLGFIGQIQDACQGFTLLVNNQTSISESLRNKALEEAVQLGCINN